MSPVRHLPHAPIKEALIDCQFTGTWNREIADVASELGGSAGRISDLIETSFTLALNNEQGKSQVDSSSSSRVGKRIDFEDAKQVLQIQRTSFTFSQLTPYRSWEEIVGRARDVWNVLSATVADIKVSRLTVRYINVIELALPFSEFGEFLTSAPSVPQNLPQGLSQFLVRTVSPIDNDMVVVTQSLKSTDITPETAKIVIDIEVACHDGDHLSEPNLLQTLERLRSRKNDVFFSYVTEKTLEMYK